MNGLQSLSNLKLCWINRAQRSKIFWKVLDLIKLIMNASLGVYDLDLQGCCLRVPAYASETVWWEKESVGLELYKWMTL